MQKSQKQNMKLTRCTILLRIYFCKNCILITDSFLVILKYCSGVIASYIIIIIAMLKLFINNSKTNQLILKILSQIYSLLNSIPNSSKTSLMTGYN